MVKNQSSFFRVFGTVLNKLFKVTRVMHRLSAIHEIKGFQLFH